MRRRSTTEKELRDGGFSTTEPYHVPRSERPQKPVQERSIDALLRALREAENLTWGQPSEDTLERIRYKLGEVLLEAKTVKSQLREGEGR